MYCLVYVMDDLDLLDVLLCIVFISAGHGIQEISGSIPLTFTTRSLETLVFQGFFHARETLYSAYLFLTGILTGITIVHVTQKKAPEDTLPYGKHRLFYPSPVGHC